MTAVVVGGSSGLGRALCAELAARGRDLVVVASREEDCRRLADHLRLLHGVDVTSCAIDARNPAAFRDALLRALDGVASVDDLFLPMGLAFDNDQIGMADRTIEDLWRINYAAVVLALEAVLPRMAEKHTRIVGFGSIAAVRIRNRNVQYSAAKAALAAYFSGLRQALVAQPQVAQFYVVGYIDSGQSFGKTRLFPPMSAQRAARRVLNDGDHDFGERFLPRYWTLVALALRLLPWRVFSRLDL